MAAAPINLMRFFKTPKRLYNLRTSNGRSVGVRRADGRICVSSGAGDYAPLYCHLGRRRTSTCFLIPDEAFSGVLTLRGSNWTGRIMPFRLHRVVGTYRVRISDPYLRVYASIWTETDDYGAEVAVNPGVTFGELFTLSPVTHPPEKIVRDAEVLDATLQHPPDGASVLDDLVRGSPDPEVIEVLSRFIERRHEGRLAERLKSDRRIIQLVQSAAQDIWAKAALPGLVDWLDSGRRDISSPQVIDRTFDGVEHQRTVDSGSAFSLRCVRALRRSIKPERNICILTTARNEGVYFIDWLSYHRVLGVEKFFVYTNDNDDGSDALLAALSDAGLITLIFNQSGEGVRPQFKAYAHALQVLPDILDFRWVAAIDLDEYIVCSSLSDDCISKFLEKMEGVGADAVGLPWAWHDPLGAVVWEDAPVNERFPAYRPDYFRHVKSVFKPNRFINSQCHCPDDDMEAPRTYRSVDGRAAKAGPFHDGGADHPDVWVAHHLLKSLEELVVRRSRNRGDGTVVDVSGDGIFTEFMSSYESDHLPWKQEPLRRLMIDEDFSKKIKIEKESILKINAVLAAEAECKAWFGPESARVRAALGRDPRFRAPGSVEARVLDLLDRACGSGVEPKGGDTVDPVLNRIC